MAHGALGPPSAKWIYRTSDGAILGYVLRFDNRVEKTFLPLTFCETRHKRRDWRWKAWPPPRPLYGLDRLSARPDTPVVVCEGEKAADAAGSLLPDWVAITSPNGSKAAGKADWASLRGRRVLVWPDADEAGNRYAANVARVLETVGAGSVSILTPPADAAAGWDAADAKAEG